MARSKSQNNHLIFIILAIIVIGVVIVGKDTIFKTASPLSQKSTVENQLKIPATWENYSNTKHGISFSYPDDWNFKVITDNNDYLSTRIYNEDTSQEKIEVYGELMYPTYDIFITVEKNPDNLSPKDFYLNNFTPSARESALEEITEEIINDVAVVRYQEGMAKAATQAARAALFTKGNKAYRVVFQPISDPEMNNVYDDVYQKVLSSISLD